MRSSGLRRARPAKKTLDLLPTLGDFDGIGSLGDLVRQRRIGVKSRAKAQLTAGLATGDPACRSPRPVHNREHQPGDRMVIGISVVVAKKLSASFSLLSPVFA